MDYRQIIEILNDTKSLAKFISMNSDVCGLKRLLYTVLVLKSRIKKGEIAKTVNIQISLLNTKYGTNFNCEKDEDFELVLNEVINYIEEKEMKEFMKKIGEKVLKNKYNRLNNQ